MNKLITLANELKNVSKNDALKLNKLTYYTKVGIYQYEENTNADYNDDEIDEIATKLMLLSLKQVSKVYCALQIMKSTINIGLVPPPPPPKGVGGD